MRPPPPDRSLSAKLLVLTIFFVMLAEVLIFLPSIARFRVSWLEERLEAGHIAALTREAAPDQMVTIELERRLLALVGARMIDLSLPGNRIYMLGEMAAPGISASYDLREAGPLDLIAEAVAILVRQPDRIIHVTGTSPKDREAVVALVLDEAPLAEALLDFAWRILGLSVVISLITAALVFLSLRWLLVRPMQRITASMVAFRENPEAPAGARPPSPRRDEVGMAERELASMQDAVRTALRQQARLAALGTAVTKINHDLRNILSTAVLLSERLAASGDPQVRRVTPRLMQAIDRAVDLCGQTLAYTRDGALPLERRPVDLRALLTEIGQELLPDENDERRLELRVPAGLCVPADREQLHRAFLNLGRNAFEAGARTVAFEAAATGERVAVTVADDGPGLPPRARENLFQPFAGSARAGGTGLGLAIAREIARAHGGDLRLIDSTAEGTSFVLELPIRPMPGA